MEFQFINYDTARESRSRRLIRSHVMKGKNLGRVIPARGWKGQSPRCPCTQKSNLCKVADGDEEMSEDRQRSLPLPEKDMALSVRPPNAASESTATLKTRNIFAGSELSYIHLPVQVTTHMRYLIYEFNSIISNAVYPRVFCGTSPGYRYGWLTAMVRDETSFHCTIAVAATYVSLLAGHQGQSLAATWHVSEALRLLGRDLSDESPQQDPTIAVVVSLVIHANLTGVSHTSHIHLDALERMLKLRPGGLMSVRQSNKMLMQKICRADFEVAILEGTPMRFGATGSKYLAPALPTRGQRPVPFILPRALAELAVPLQYITRDILILGSYPESEKLDPYRYQDILVSICQELILFAPLGRRPDNMLDDVWQLGLIAFMMTILYPMREMRLHYTEALTRMLHNRLADPRVLGAASRQGAHFWLLFVHGFSVLDRGDDGWLVPQISTAAAGLGVSTWEGVRRKLQEFPWIATMHDTRGKRLWDMVTALEQT